MAITPRDPRTCFGHTATGSGWQPPLDIHGHVSDIQQLVGNHPKISSDMFQTYCNWLTTTLRYPWTCLRHTTTGWQPLSDILEHVSYILQLFGNYHQISSGMFQTYRNWLVTTFRYPRICRGHTATGWQPPSDILGHVSVILQLVGNHLQISSDMSQIYRNWLKTTLRYPRTCVRHIATG